MAYPKPSKNSLSTRLFAVFVLTTVVASFLAWPAIARARDTSSAVVESTTQLIETLNGREEFRIDQYLNERGEKELAVYHEEFRALLDTEAVVLYGRDLDHDGRFDAWFVMGKGGVIQATDQVSSDGDGWDVVSSLVRKHPSAMKNRWLIRALLHWLNGYAGFIGRAYFDQVDRTQINLHSAEIRADRIAKANKRHPMLGAYYQQIGIEWTRLGEETQKRLLGTIAWDAAVIVGPIYVTKALTAILARLGIDLAGSPIAVFFRKLYDNYVRAIFDATKSSATRVLGKFRISPTIKAHIDTATGPFKLVAGRASARVNRLLEIMESHDALSRTLAHGFKQTLELGRAGLSQKAYILQTQGVQLSMEVLSRRDELWHPNPIVLSKKIASDKDLLQNLGFMTSETFMLAGMSKLQPNIPKRLVICAALAVVNTVATSYIIKGETDMERIKFDATWEALVGNGQTLLDTTALGLSAHYAEKIGKPHFKLVGFAIALVDQAAGYFFYAEKTQKLNGGQKQPTSRSEDVPVRFIPIMAPI